MKKRGSKVTTMTVKVIWPELDYMPDTNCRHRPSGWASLEEMQKVLKERFRDKRPELLPNGIRYYEQFNAFGFKALRIFEITLH